MTSHRAADGSVAAGTGLAVTSVASVQFGAALAATLFPLAGALGTVTLRLVGAALVLLVLTRPWRRSWTRAELGAAGLFGAVFTAMNASLYLAIERLPLAAVITIEFLGPLGVAVGTAGSWRTRSWALPAGAGVVLLGAGLSGGELTGVAFALAAACCWATYIVLSSRIGRTGTGFAGLGLATVFGAVVMLPIGLATAGASLLHPGVLALGALVGVVSSAIPYSLDLLALRQLPTAVFGVLTSLNPAGAALAGFVVLDQLLSDRELLGIALVVLASVGVTVDSARTARAQGRLRPAAATAAAAVAARS